MIICIVLLVLISQDCELVQYFRATCTMQITKHFHFLDSNNSSFSVWRSMLLKSDMAYWRHKFIYRVCGHQHCTTTLFTLECLFMHRRIYRTCQSVWPAFIASVQYYLRVVSSKGHCRHYYYLMIFQVSLDTIESKLFYVYFNNLCPHMIEYMSFAVK